MFDIKYPNLRAEMARRNVSIQAMAKVLNKSRNTVSGEISGRQPMFLDEAFMLARGFFPDCDIRYLFSSTPEHQKNTDAS